MMYTVNYAFGSENVQIRFATLEDACFAAASVKQAGIAKVSVSDTDDPDAFYMVPRDYWNPIK